jgi:hypothetical protein
MRFRNLVPAGVASSTCLGLAMSVVLAAPALADTAFGGDPNQPVLAGANCSADPPNYPGAGNTSCLWETTDPSGGGSDYVPFSASGGSGTITSVTLPAMPNPGPMQAVVMTAALATTTDPGHPDFACCQTKAISPTFTVPANRVTTVPLDLHVTSSEVNDPNKPGDTALSDIMAISVLSPTASLPLRYTGSGQLVNAIAYPAPRAPSGEFAGYGTVSGFQLLARFTLGTGDAVGGGTNGTTVSPAGGVKLGKTVGVPAGARKVTVGTATNPPTAATRQRLTATPKALGATAAAKKKKKAKRKTVGTGKTTVKAGKSSSIRVSLSRTARRRLAHGHKVKCTLTVVATGTTGAKSTVTRSVTLKPKKAKKKKK